MFIVKLRYKCPIEEVNKYLQAHRDFLDYYFKQGLFLAAGPMQPRTGDILLALTKDQNHLESVIQQDPYLLADIADYELTAFTPVNHQLEIKDLILTHEGKLC